jgi:hypothetical protein
MQSPADRVIAKFGGLRPLAKALGHQHTSTVQGWKERGLIPVRHFPAIQRAANERGLRVEAADFMPVSAEVTAA